MIDAKLEKGGAKVRLDKRVSQSGLTRSVARDRIRAGLVKVSGEVVRDPGASVADDAVVRLDGVVLPAREGAHWMLHKPAGCVSARVDGRFPTVYDCLPGAVRARRDLCCVGRLDRDVTGLLLFTSDGELAHRLISPRRGVEKIYLARVQGPLGPEHEEAMARGVDLGDFQAKGARLLIRSVGETSLAELAVTEGKFHQVKRMFAAIGHPVLTLHRLSEGGVRLDPSLVPGACRPLTERELAQLFAQTGLSRQRESQIRSE